MSTEKASGNAALLRFLVRAGVVASDAAQVAEAEIGGQPPGTTVIEWLVRRGIATEQEVAEVLAKGLQLPVANLATMALSSSVTSLVREELAMQYLVVPVRIDENGLAVATANPLDRAALRAIEFATGKRVHAEVATLTAIRDALEHSYHLDDSLGAYLKGVPDEGDMPVAELKHEPTKDIRSLMRETNLAPVVKLLNSILIEALRQRASDIHIEPGAVAVRVRYRIDGILEEALRLPKWVQDPLIARSKVLSKLDITERRVPQDGRMHVQYREAMVDLRVSSLPTQFGEKVTMRVLDPVAAPSGLDGLSFSARDLKCIRQALARPEGMILVTGPTGCGKTTTLYGMIAEVVSSTRNIVTIENPIEYQIDGLNQVEINEKQGLTFAGTLRSILRQDPDVILVGEIRDAETAEVAIRAAQTGHLVLSTLHTNDAAATITRLLDLGIEPYMFASSLHLIIAQRLVRRVCEQCAEPYEPSPEALRLLQIDPAGQQFRRGRGCSACRKSGSVGRIGIFEVLQNTPKLARLVEAKAPESALRAQARADGTTFLADHAATRVCDGRTTVEEVLRVVDIETEILHCPACDRAIEDTFAVCPHCATALQCRCPSCKMLLQPEWLTCPYCGASTRHASASPETQKPPTPTQAPEAPRPHVEARQYRALVVDDHADMRRLIAFTIEHSGLPISTATAADGYEALDLAQQSPPDFVLLDVMMPGMDGFEVCERLRAHVRTAFIPILMLTARDDAASRARGFLAGTDDYVAKPFARAELLARVRRLLERSYGAILPQPRSTAEGPAPEPASDVILQ